MPRLVALTGGLLLPDGWSQPVLQVRNPSPRQNPQPCFQERDLEKPARMCQSLVVSAQLAPAHGGVVPAKIRFQLHLPRCPP